MLLLINLWIGWIGDERGMRMYLIKTNCWNNNKKKSSFPSLLHVESAIFRYVFTFIDRSSIQWCFLDYFHIFLRKSHNEKKNTRVMWYDTWALHFSFLLVYASGIFCAQVLTTVSRITLPLVPNLWNRILQLNALTLWYKYFLNRHHTVNYLLSAMYQELVLLVKWNIYTNPAVKTCFHFSHGMKVPS